MTPITATHPLYKIDIGNMGDLTKLSRDVIKNIFELFASGADLKSIVSSMNVCHGFRDFCLDSVASNLNRCLPEFFQLPKLPPLNKRQINQTNNRRAPPEVPEHSKAVDLLFLTCDSKDNKYYTSFWSNRRNCLYIFTYSGRIFAVDLVEFFKSAHLISQDHEFISLIVNVHPTATGFILVSRGIISVWRFDDKHLEEPKCEGFYPVSNENQHDNQRVDTVYTSMLSYPRLYLRQFFNQLPGAINILGMVEKIRDLNPNHSENNWRVFDFSSADPQLVRFNPPPNGSKDTKLFESKGDLFLLSFIGDENLCKKVRRTQDNQLEVVSEFNIPGRTDMSSFLFVNQWLVQKNGPDHYLFVINTQTEEVWIDAKMGIRTPNAGDVCFIDNNGLLFVHYFESGTIRLIDVPNKIDLTGKFKSVFPPDFLKNQLIHSFNLVMDKQNGGVVLRVVLQQKKGDITLHSAQIKIPNFPEQLTANSPAQIENHENTEQHVNSESSDSPIVENPAVDRDDRDAFVFRRSDALPAASLWTVSKVMLVAGSIFCLITAILALATVHFVIPTGSIIFQGSGIVLTLPNLLILIGGSGSLILIALGSYFWWKERNHSH
jgi:hypothetical protein